MPLGGSLSFGKESACRDSLSFEAGFCLHGVSLSVGRILSSEVESVYRDSPSFEAEL